MERDGKVMWRILLGGELVVLLRVEVTVERRCIGRRIKQLVLVKVLLNLIKLQLLFRGSLRGLIKLNS